jgi:phospholipase C
MKFREVLDAVDPNGTVLSARQLARLISAPPLSSLRRLLHLALAWRMQHQSLIRHVFVLMLENRSFDHIFGYSGIDGIDSKTDMQTNVEDLRQHDGENVNPLTNQIIKTSPTAPLSLSNVAGGVDVEHEFHDVLTQLCGPEVAAHSDPLPGGVYPRIDMSGFVADFVMHFPAAPPETPMQCFHPRNLPVLNKLAKEFVICDHWFAALPGPTWPNRFFVHAASPSTERQSDSPGDRRIAETQVIPLGIGPGKFHFANGTIYDKLAEKRLKFKIYCGNDCPQVSGIRASTDDLDLNWSNLSSLQRDLQDPNYPFSYIFIEPDNGTPDHTIFGVGSHCNSVKQNDMHPPSNVQDGEALIKQVYETIRNSPVWNQSMFVLVFDEHGGFFDHVIPPGAQAPGDDGNGGHNFRFDQLGVRVPALIISPWVGRNVIDHTIYDHTSLLATVEKLFGLTTLTNRDATASDFLEVFSQIAPRDNTPNLLRSPF